MNRKILKIEVPSHSSSQSIEAQGIRGKYHRDATDQNEPKKSEEGATAKKYSSSLDDHAQPEG
jgi:hypothetical protein